MKKFEPRAQPSSLSHPGAGARKLPGDTSRFRILALAITLLAVATFGILYAAVAHGQNSAGALTGLTLSSDTPGTLTVSWDHSSPDPTDYRINWAKSSEEFPSWTSNDGNLYPTATSVELTGLDQGVEYKVRARARYWDGDNADNPWGGPWAEGTLQVKGNPQPEQAEEPPQPDQPPPAANATKNKEPSSAREDLPETWTEIPHTGKEIDGKFYKHVEDHPIPHGLGRRHRDGTPTCRI